MRTHRADYTATTQALFDFVDITDEVQGMLTGSPVNNGQITVFTDGPSCSLIVNERESGLLEDLRSTMRRLNTTSAQDRRALLGSSSVVLPVVDGRLHLGDWQRVLLVELEEPGPRRIVVQMVGE